MSKVNVVLNAPAFDILLPVGISFYTFQALSYTMDVYRDEIPAEKNFFRYALFVSFFPQLVAGPIERSKNLLNQLSEPKKFSFDNAEEGFLLMLWGYFLKIVLADRTAVFVDTVYGDCSTYPGYYLVTATVLFAVQIYCDFAGYSSIAKGSAKILGIELTDNFDAPYLSVSVAEFWRKWHISLTSWFRDYLYIPMGGNRKGKARTFINKMTVSLVSGLWHGASFSFVVWGAVNGLYQIAGEILRPFRNRADNLLNVNTNSFGYKLFRVFVTFVLVDFSWIFFRAESFKASISVIRSIFTANNPWVLFDGSLYTCGLDAKNFVLMMICTALLLFADILKHRKVNVRKILMKQDCWFKIPVFSALVLLILVFGKWGPAFDAANFIYFQF